MIYPALSSLLNYHEYSDQLITAGQPTPEQFKQLAINGVKTVINLALPDSPGAIEDEQSVVQQNTMRYVPIPVNFKQPELQQLNEFYSAMDSASDALCLVHCAYNWRVSVFVYLYRIHRLHDDRKQAFEEMQSVWVPDKTWSQFIAAAGSMNET